uniref:Uncharacterized protein n=1 Tax=Leersia perrieri TaxID=77586 RepID=A0A0D9V9W0_9ORYZ
MESHSAAAAARTAKRMWGYIRAVFFMVRKSSSKRRLILTFQLAFKRRNRAVARSVANLLSHGAGAGAVRRREYEFSCSNSPDVIVPAGNVSRRRMAPYFPCLGAEEDDVYDAGAAATAAAAELGRIEYYAAAAASPAPSSSEREIVLQEEEIDWGCAMTPARSPLPGTIGGGGYSVRVSNYSEEDDGEGGGEAVDDEAEEFIRRFYEQLRRQNNQLALLPSYVAA